MARYVPARLNTLNHKIYPPSRVLSFNQRLDQNDGLLAGYLSEKSNISFEESIKEITIFTGKLRKDLLKHSKVHLLDIGSLTTNAEGGIIFEPEYSEDLWDDGFGLNQLMAPPIVYRVKSKRKTVAKLTRKPEAASTRVPSSVKWTLRLGVPVIIFLLFGIISPKGVQHLQSNYSDIRSGIFWLQTDINATSNTSMTRHIEPYYLNNLEYRPEVFVRIPVLSEKMSPGIYPDPAEPISPRYHIIVGTINSLEKAEGYANSLSEKGFPAIIAGKNKFGHYRISLNSFLLKKEALEELAAIRNDINPDAWLLKK